MSSKNIDKPHLRDWLRNFSKSAVVSSKKILGESMPNLKTTVDSANTIAAETRTFITRTKSGMNMQTRSLESTRLGRNATEIIRDAMSDIKTGNFSLEKSAEFSLGFDDDSFYDIGEGLDLTNPEDFATNEERKNVAKIGKVISRTSAASIEGMRAMTHTIAKATIKSQESSTAKLLNANLFGFNQINTQMNQINNHLYNVNQNLSAMIRFQNENTSATNQAAVEYYQASSEMLSKLGENIAELVDYKNKIMKTDNTKDPSYSSSDTPIDFRSGFDLRDYAKHIKNNIKNNPYVMLGSMFTSMGSMGGGSLKDLIRPTEWMMEALIKHTILPKKTRSSLGKLDKMTTNAIQNLLYRLGDMSEDYSNGAVARLIGDIFGVKRSKLGSVSLGDFKKDAMSWNGKSQQALVEVIPSYLSNIEAAIDALNRNLGVDITSYNRRYYDMDDGIFKNEKKLKKEIEDNYKNTIEYSMNEIASKIEKALNKTSSSDSDKENIRNEINDIINKRISGEMTNNRDYSSKMRNLLSSDASMSTREIGSVMMDLENSIRESINNINSFNKSIETDLSGSVYRNVLNNGEKISSYRSNANIFSSRNWLNGVDLSSVSDAEAERLRRQQEDNNRLKNAKKGFFNKIKNLFGIGGSDSQNYDTRLSNNIDRLNDTIFESYLFMNDHMDNPSDIPRDIKNNVRARYRSWRNSRRTNRNNGPTPQAGSLGGNPQSDSTNNNPQPEPANNNPQNSLGGNPQPINSQSASSNRTELTPSSTVVRLTRRLQQTVNGTMDQAMNSSSRDIDRDMNNSSAIIENTMQSVNDMDPMTANVLTMKGFVSDIHNKFLKPMSSKIFGKDGFLQNFYNNPMVQKGIDYIKEKLFNEQTGLFAPLIGYFKDGVNYLKYEITGKEYTDRKGNTHPQKKENTVLSHIRDTYDFVFTNTMKYLFGDDYKSNQVYKDIFNRFDWKGKKEKEENNERKIQSNGRKYLPDSTKTNIVTSTDRKIKSAKFNNINTTEISTQNNTNGTNNEVQSSNIRQTIQNAVSETANRITTAGSQFTDSVFGNNNNDTMNQIHQENKKLFGKLKQKFPKMLAGAAIGAGTIALTGGHIGLLGSLFLPNSIIGGATLGIATSLLTENEKFKKFIFGEEDEDGVKKNGIFSDKMQKAFKKSLPLIVGGATLGAVKTLFTGSVAPNNMGGMLLSSFLPGGIIGGAILGTGFSLLRNNETLNRILFGEKPDDENGKRGILSKGMNKISSFLGNSKKFIVGGLKGIGAGLLTGTVVSHMGLLGSAATIGGPIGMAVAGLATGIAMQTRRFQELLFGTEEFDEDGNPTGKRNKDGIFTQARNLLVVNVFEPIKNKLEDTTVDFAYWAKDKILYPFRLAFGPILDSMSQIKDNVSDFLKDKFEALSTSIGEMFKRTIKTLFSPFTRLLGKIGGLALSAVTTGLKMSLSPITLPLKVLSGLTMFARGKEYVPFMKSLYNNIASVKDKWDNDETDYGKGPMGFVRKMKSRVSDIGTAYNVSRDAYNEVMTANGYNHLGWRNVGKEKEEDRRNKKEIRDQRRKRNRIDKLVKEYTKEDKGKQVANWSKSKLKLRQKQLKNAGVNVDGIQTIEDIQDLMYNRSAWNQKYDPDAVARNSATINADNQAFQQETQAYQEQVKSDFAKIIELMTKEAEERAAEKKRQTADKRYRSQLKKMKKNMERAGIDPEELQQNGVDFSDYVGYMDIPQSMWEEYLDSPEYNDGDLDGWIQKNINRIYEYDEDKVTKYKRMRNRKRFSGKVHRRTSSNDNTQNNENDSSNTNGNENADRQSAAVVDQLSILNEIMSGGRFDSDKFYSTMSSKPGKNIVKATMSNRHLDEAHISESEEEESRQKSAKIFSDSLLSGLFKRKKKDNQRAKEEDESKRARSLANNNSSESNNENDEAIIDDIDEDTEAEQEKGGLISTLLGGTSSLLGGVFNWLSNGATWQKFGIGFTLAALFSDKIKDSQIITKLGNFVSENIPTLFSGFTTFVNDYGPKIIETTANTISTLMPDLLNATFSIAKATLETLGNSALETLGIKTKSKTIDNPEEAQDLMDKGINLQDNGDGTYTQLGSRTYVDENGETKSNINSNMVETIVKHPKKAYSLVRGVMKAATFVPNKIFKYGVKAVNRVVNTTEAGIRILSNKVGGEKVAKAGNIVKNTSKTAFNYIKKTFTKIISKLEKLATNPKIVKWVDSSIILKAVRWLRKFVTTWLSKLADTKVAKFVYSKLTAGVAEAAGKGGSKFIPLIGQALVVYDAASGFMEADNLFDVNSDDVDFGMRTISSLMKTILGLGIGPLFDLMLELLKEISGKDVKKEFATTLYTFFMDFIGDTSAIDKIKESQNDLEQETANYNMANGTNLTTDAYSDLKNAPWWKKWINGSDEDYSKYEVGNFDSSKYINNTEIGSATISETAVAGYGISKKNTVKSKSNKNRAVGYGSSQHDPRWANYPIGRFADGSVSTMATGGCGPTALSMVANNLSGKNTNPLSIARFAKNNGYISEGGANEKLFTDGASKMGLESSKVSSGSLTQALKTGKTMIVAGKSNSSSSPYTSAGHILAVKGTNNGSALVSDPETGRTTEMDTSDLKSGMTHGWTYKSKSVGYGTTQTASGNIPTPKEVSTNTSSASISTISATSAPDVTQTATGVVATPESVKKSSAVSSISSLFTSLMKASTIPVATGSSKKKKKPKKNSEGIPVKLAKLYANGNMVTEKDILFGELSIPSGTINWENPKFYIGKSYENIKNLTKYYKDLMRYNLFNVIHGNIDKLIATGGNLITKKDIESLLSQYSTRSQLYDGVESIANDTAKYLKYKNGAVFYQQTNAAWRSLPWKSSNIGKRGDDLTSMAMILSTYSNNALTPNYIYENWLTQNPEWYNEERGLTKKAFANGGLNGMLESRSSNNTNERLKISANTTPSAIKSALKNRKLVYMKGYQYTDSIFGGTGEKTDVVPGKSPTHSVVGTFVNDKIIAINDPNTGVNSFSLFPVARLSDKVGKDTNVIKEAYIVSNPDGTGVDTNISVNDMKLPESKYSDPSEAETWLGKTTAVVGNVISVFDNLIESIISGKKYESIFTEKFDDDINTGYDDGTTDSSAIVETESTSSKKSSKNKSKKSTKKKGAKANKNKKVSTSSTSNSSAVPQPISAPTTTRTTSSAALPIAAPSPTANNDTKKQKATVTISSLFGTLKNAAGSKKVGNGIGYGYENPFLKHLFGISNDSASTTIDDGIIPSGTESVSSGDWIGKYVEKNESGSQGSAMVSSGSGDAGGVSFGTYQFPSYGKAKADSSSQLYQFWSKYYANSNPGVVPGNNSAFIDAWKSEARSNPDQFHSNEHAYIGSKYYTPQKNRIRGVLDPDTHSRSAQEMVWSSGVQYGPSSSVIVKALNSQNSQSMGVRALVNKVQDYKANTVGSYFSSSSSSVKAGVKNRHDVTERNILLGIADKAPLDGMGGGSATISVGYGKGNTGIILNKTGKAIGYGSADSARNAVVSIMKSLEGQLEYSMKQRDPAKGSGDCSSTVQYCYKKAVNLDPGSTSRAQAASSKGITVDTGTGKGPNISNLKPGDLLFYGSSHNSTVSHVEMYVGDGMLMGHGGGSTGKVKGPLYHDASTYRTSGYISAKRYIKDDSDLTINSYDESNYSSKNSTTTTDKDSLSPLTNIISKVTNVASDMFDRAITKTTSSKSKKKKFVGNGLGHAEKYFVKTLNGKVTSGYGMGYGLGNHFHRGIDIGAEENSPIYSPVNGTVITNGYDAVGYGNHVVVQDENGYNHLFAHLNKQSNLSIGDKVSENDIIGNVGTTGKSTGNHLHYEVRKGYDKHTSINPNEYAKTIGYGKHHNSTKSIYEQQMANKSKNTEERVGGVSKNISNDSIIKKLNVAVNTDGVENKLDILIDVMKDWASKSEKTSKSIIQSTTNVGFGKGSQKSSGKSIVVEKPVIINNKDNESKNDTPNRSIHDMIAKVESYA